MIAPAPAPERRRALRAALANGALLRFPGAFAPIVAKLIERQGFDGAYVSGAALAADLGLPDIGLVTQSEVVARAQAIARACTLPVIVDVDTGFGAPLNAARTIALLEEAGLAGCHLEDQEAPKRCGHLERKTLVPTPEMVRRVRAAAEAQTDADFLLIARTDARAPEGLAKAIDRAKAYVDAGAAMIFPEALQDEREFEAFRAALDVPLMANMTEFGKSPPAVAQRAGGARLQSGDLPGHHLPARHEGSGGGAPGPRRERQSAGPRAAHDDQGAPL